VRAGRVGVGDDRGRSGDGRAKARPYGAVAQLA